MFARPRMPALLSIMTWLIGAAALMGCASPSGTLDVRVPHQESPSQGRAAKIIRVTDRRVFEVEPGDPAIPSLADGEGDDPAIPSRTIARLRIRYDKDEGYILLPQGRSVERVTHEAVTRGLRRGGIRVLDDDDPGHDSATPLEVDIDQFWAWSSPGYWRTDLEFRARVRVTGELEPFTAGEVFEGYVRLDGQSDSDRAWLETVSRGLEDLANQIAIAARLRAGSGPGSSRP